MRFDEEAGRMLRTDQRGSWILGRRTCLGLLAAAGADGRLGHLAVCADGVPHITPVNFRAVEATVFVRLGPGFFSEHLDGVTTSFEVDHASTPARRGWSVVATGPARLLDLEEVARLGRNLPSPIVLRPGMHVFSITLDAVSGRAVRHEFTSQGLLPTSLWDEDWTH
ncbi:MAG TPA: pyridoxamine 5'-phosphate oxidase family protein [Acidimicrobiales bacterium]|nr:pyridoxamine 5'-phosphate oxidase family protein [Acidimicrobiales bacterium]